MKRTACQFGSLAALLLISEWVGVAAQPALVDEAGRPRIIKKGTIDCDLVETTPIVFKGRLYRFEWVRKGYWDNALKQDYFRLVDSKTGQPTAPFAFGHEFGSAFVERGKVYVTGTDSTRCTITMFASKDLKTWQQWTVFHDPSFGMFNTSLCKAGREYVLMFEIDRPSDQAGVPFTARFLKSKDLRHWDLTPPECNYAKDRYSAPHCLRYLDGYYYDFYLEAHNGYEMRVVRSTDLIHWEPSPLNPVLKASDEDRQIRNLNMPPELRRRIATAANLNNSDIDFCEYHGELLINYSWGNQQGTEFLAEAVFPGSEKQFLRGWFSDQGKTKRPSQSQR
jgi:hypothetical protein